MTASRTYTFVAGTTYAVTHNVNWVGYSNLKLRSTVPGVQWKLKQSPHKSIFITFFIR